MYGSIKVYLTSSYWSFHSLDLWLQRLGARCSRRSMLSNFLSTESWRASQSANIGIYHILIQSASLAFVWLTRFVPRKFLQCFSDYSIQQFQILPVIFVSTSHKCDLTSYDSGHRIKGQRGRHSLVDILARFLSVQGIFFSFLCFIFSSMATTVIRLSECLSDTSIIEVLISHR